MLEGAGRAQPLQISILMSEDCHCPACPLPSQPKGRPKQGPCVDRTAMSDQGFGFIAPEQQVLVSFTVDKAGIEVVA